MNIRIVMEELRVARGKAFDLLMKHSFDPCVVRMRETIFNALLNGSLEDDRFELRQLRTALGTTVLVDTNADLDTVFSFKGKYVYADRDGSL